MDQPNEPREELNPYQSPTDLGQAEPLPNQLSYNMPPLHWPRTFGMFAVFAIAGLVTYGTTLIFFGFPILFGGVRTALIYRGCYREARVPPSYVLSTILSPISCFLFQIGATIAFTFVCATGLSIRNTRESVLAWTILSAIVGLAVFVGLYIASIKVTIASCRHVS